MRRSAGLGAAILVALAAAGCSNAEVPVADARAELRALVEDVTAATAARFGLVDDRGHGMGTLKVVPAVDAGGFAGVYFAWSENDAAFHVHVASSDNLLDWRWEGELGALASQPSIAVASDGGFVVAWEQEPDPIHIVIASYATWDDLRAGRMSRRFDAPVTMPACGEGTPTILSASSERVDLSFHYHADCNLDREAAGHTDWTSWQASARPEIDRALIDLGVAGHIGDRDTIMVRGHELMLVEGQRVLDDPRSWRTYLYDPERGAEQLRFVTPAKSIAFMNPTITRVSIDGRAAVVMTLYLPDEGARGNEAGELIYYRLLDEG